MIVAVPNPPQRPVAFAADNVAPGPAMDADRRSRLQIPFPNVMLSECFVGKHSGWTNLGEIAAELAFKHAVGGTAEINIVVGAEYIEIATSLAHDLLRLSQLRTTMRDRMRCCPLTDIQSRTRDFEGECRTLWRKWCSGKPGVHLSP